MWLLEIRTAADSTAEEKKYLLVFQPNCVERTLASVLKLSPEKNFPCNILSTFFGHGRAQYFLELEVIVRWSLEVWGRVV